VSAKLALITITSVSTPRASGIENIVATNGEVLRSCSMF
jgi:hypothetical protein